VSAEAQLDEQEARAALYREMVQSIIDSAQPAIEELAAIEAELAARRLADAFRSSVPPIFKPFWAPARYKGAHGGRGSAKSWSFGTMLLERANRVPGLRAVCVREVQRSLEQSVKRLLEDLIEKFGIGGRFKVLNTHIETPGDGIIIFQGMQNHTAESIKSLEGYDLAWVEEAQSLSERSLTLLRPTLRKEGSELWFTWNPRHASDPIDRFLRGGLQPPNSIVLKATYRDNPYLPSVLREELEWDESRDPDKFAHIWMGEYEKHSETRVFKNWRVDDFDTPSDVSFLFGGDWGFSIDPTVLLRGWVDGRTLFIDQEVYKVGCEIDRTPELFDQIGNGMARGWQIVTDSARPETIAYMQSHGYPNVVAAKKGPNSVKEGIEFLKSYDIVIHRRCTHTSDEFTHYSYKRHPLTNEITPVLQDKENHVIDSARYMVEPLRSPQEPEEFATW